MNLPMALQESKPPYIDFRHDFIEDRGASDKNGRYMAKDVEIVTLTPAGDNKTLVEEYVPRWLDNLKARLRNKAISQEFYDYCVKSYDVWKDKGVMDLIGTPIKGWALLSAAQQENLISINIRTVEDLATLTEDGLAAIGMGARALKTKAKTWLDEALDSGVVAQRMASVESDLESERMKNEDLLNRINALEKAAKKK